jgi:hypothetical protein
VIGFHEEGFTTQVELKVRDTKVQSVGFLLEDMPASSRTRKLMGGTVYKLGYVITVSVYIYLI